MTRSRKELKLMARRALRGHYGTVVGAVMLTYLLMVLFILPLYFLIMIGSVLGSMSGRGATGVMIAGIAGIYLLILVVMSVVMGGYTYICYCFCTGRQTRVEDLAYAFRRHPMRFMGVTLLLAVIGIAAALPGIAVILLGKLYISGQGGMMAVTWAGSAVSMFLVIVVPLRWFFALFILVEDPEQRVGDCLSLSRELTDGNKMRIFKQTLSFWGIALLTYPTFGLAMLWVLPYIICTNIYLYLDIKEEKFPTRPADYGNYGDFYI